MQSFLALTGFRGVDMQGVGAWIRFGGLMLASGLLSFHAVQVQCHPLPSHPARPLLRHELACV